MEDAFGVIVVIICLVAAVVKGKKKPSQRRSGRPSGSPRSPEQTFQEAFDRLSEKLEPAAQFIDDVLTKENDYPSARRSAEVFDEEDAEEAEAATPEDSSSAEPVAGSRFTSAGEATQNGSLGASARVNDGSLGASTAAQVYSGSLGEMAGNGRFVSAAEAAQPYAGSLGASARPDGGSLGASASARANSGSLGGASALRREPLAAGMSRADANGCLGGSLSGHSEEGESRAEHARHLREADAQQREVLREEARDLSMRQAARSELRRAVVWSEILDKPKALRRR